MEENVKINFFKKIWYSITKPSKYEDLRRLGLGKAIKYIFSIIAIVALILAIISSVIQQNILKEAISYLEEKLPEIKFKDNTLTLENEEDIVINDNKVIDYFRNVIVINPLIEKQEAINQYKTLATEKNNVLIFLNKEYLVISNKYNSERQEGIDSKKYEEVSSKYIKDMNYEYGKKDIINYLKRSTSYTYYIAQYFVVYFIMITFLYLIYILLISLSLRLVTKLSKIKWTYKESLINTIYASTLSLIIYATYMIIGYFINFKISFIDVINIVIIYIYLYIILYKNRKSIIK